MEFYTISREGSGYHEDALSEAKFPSASAIRGIVRKSYENLSADSPASLKQEPGSDSKSEILFNILIPHLPAVTHPAYAGALPVLRMTFQNF